MLMGAILDFIASYISVQMNTRLQLVSLGGSGDAGPSPLLSGNESRKALA
jgi:hypothetical protein